MNKILAELDFNSLLNESMAQTKTGNDLLNKYKSFLMANESTCNLVNNFIKDAQTVRFDSGVNTILEKLSDYINTNKTLWAIATVCENINSNNSSYNYLNRNAAKQASKLLEMNEPDVVKYIKAGALKNIMFCESFRNIAKQVFKDQPIIESTADYNVIHPVSIIENVGDGLCFTIKDSVYKIDEDKNIQEISWNEVSHRFKVIASILESNIASCDSHSITIKTNNATYEITESGKCKKISKNGEQEFNVDQLRENNNLVLMATNNRFKSQVAGILEGIALITEHYNDIVYMDNVSIYTTKNDQFVIIESNNNIYAKLLVSNHQSKWVINENVIEALAFIKSKTNVTLNETFKEQISKQLENISEQEQEKLEQELHEQKILSYKERIELLTEKFKNDPVKLAVLSKLAQDISNLD